MLLEHHGLKTSCIFYPKKHCVFSFLFFLNYKTLFPHGFYRFSFKLGFHLILFGRGYENTSSSLCPIVRTGPASVLIVIKPVVSIHNLAALGLLQIYYSLRPVM